MRWKCRRPIFALTVIGVILLVVGAWMGHHVMNGLTLADLYGYADHGHAYDPDQLGPKVNTMIADRGFVWSYALLLTGFAILFWARSLSRFVRRVAGLTLLAAVITVGADLLARTVPPADQGHLQWQRTLAEALQATRWCALLVALIAVPAVTGILLRAAMGGFRCAVWRYRDNYPLLQVFVPPTIWRFISAFRINARVSEGSSAASGSSSDDLAAKARASTAESTPAGGESDGGPQGATDPGSPLAEGGLVFRHNPGGTGFAPSPSTRPDPIALARPRSG